MGFNDIKKRLKKIQEDEVIKIKGDHLSLEDNMKIFDFINNPRKDKLNVIVAPTGSGKTYSFLEVLTKTENLKVLFVVPYKSLVEGIEEQYKCEIALGRKGMKLDRFGRKGVPVPNVVVTTVDQLKHIEKNIEQWKGHMIILDEYHKYIESASFKPKVISTMDRIAVFENFKSAIAITATPESVEMMRKKDINKITFEFEKDPKTRRLYEVHTTKNRRDYSQILKMIDESIGEGEIALVYNNTSKRANKILSEKIKGGISINADSKHSEDYKFLIKEKRFKDGVRVCFSTDVITAGLDIKDERVKAIFVLWETMPSTIVQFSGRARNSNKLDIYVVNNFSPSIKDGLDNIGDFYANMLENIEDTLSRIEREKDEAEYFREKIMERYFVLNGDTIEFCQALAQLEIVRAKNGMFPHEWKSKFKEEVKNIIIEHNKEDQLDEEIDGVDDERLMDEKIEEVVDYMEENEERLVMARESTIEKIEDLEFRKTIKTCVAVYEKSGTIPLEEVAWMVIDKARKLQLMIATARVVKGIGNVGVAYMYKEIKELRKGDILGSDCILARKHTWNKVRDYIKASFFYLEHKDGNKISYEIKNTRPNIMQLNRENENIEQLVEDYKKLFFSGKIIETEGGN